MSASKKLFSDGSAVQFCLPILKCCRVSGKLEARAVISIAAGLGFTVAVTSDGKVWQMGETGATGKSPPWEGSLLPTQVSMLKPVSHCPQLSTMTTVHCCLSRGALLSECLSQTSSKKT